LNRKQKLDEAVIKYYRKLVRYGYDHMGKFDQPTIFLDTVGENIKVCAQVAQAYIHLYINISNGIIDDIKYLCMCDPTANVAVEALCSLVKGKSLDEAKRITEDDFSRVIGSKGKDFLKSAKGLIKLLKRGIERYQAKA
jgi:NifU-like protein involved in Fe-S cluster formation